MANQTSPVIQIKDSNVGIGTASPTRQLELVGADAYIQLTRSSASTQATLGFNTGATNDWLIRTGDGSTSNLQFYSYGNSSYVMTIARSSGNVGIGTTSPSTTLDVLGKIKLGLDGTYGGSDYVTIGFGGTSNGYNRVFGYNGTSDGLFLASATGQGIAFRTNGGSTDNMFIAASGNVGIGTTSPNRNLTVSGNGTLLGIQSDTVGGYSEIEMTANGVSAAYIFKNSAAFTSYAGAGSLNIYNSGSIGFHTASVTNAMFIASATGNVGIGTTSPSEKLEVVGSIKASGGLYSDNGSLAGNIGLGQVTSITSSFTSYANLQFTMHNGGGFSDIMKLQGNGNVGIGTTSPAYKLDVSGSISTNGSINLLNTDLYPFFRIGPMTCQYPYNRIDSVRSDGSGYFWGFGMQEGSTNYVKAFFIDGARGWYSADQLSVVNFNTNEFNGSYPTYTTGARIFANGASYFNGGNVGIGTTSPNTKLEVFDGDISVTTGGTFSFLNLNRNFIPNSSGVLLGGTKFRGYSTGTTYQSGVHIYGYSTEAWTSTSSPGYLSIQTTPSGSTTPVERMVVTSAGNVGIGTTAPDTSLGGTRGIVINSGASNDAQIRLQNNTTGSAATDGGLLSISGSLMYLWNYEANDLIFGTNNAESARILSNGNVGIWTTAPQKRLEVISVTNDFVSIGVAALAVGNWTGIHFGYRESNTFYRKSAIVFERTDLTANDAQGKIHILNGPQGGSGSATLADAKLTIAENGNVGIGTTTPSSRLQVTATSTSATTVDNGITILNNSAVNNCLAGIRLSTYGDVDGGLYPKQFIGAIRDGAFGAGKGSIVFCNRDAADTSVVTLSDEKMRILPDGNVGIGTTAPTEKLHVDGNVIVTYNNSYQGINSIGNKAILARVSPTTGIINYAEYATAANLNGFVMGSDDARVKGNIATDSLEFITNGSTQVTVLSNGDVGIGTTSPTEKLQVNGSLKLGDGNADGPQLKLASSGYSDWNIDNFSGSLRAYYGSTEYTRLTSSGNFGIGVTPSYKLDVAGDTRITSGSLGVGVLPDATDGRIDASNDIVAYSSSDRRLKENITPIANALDKVKSLTGVEFDWKPEHKKAHGYEGHDTGVIAQEVQEVMPTAVRTNDTGYLAVRYEKLIGLLIEANKELAARVEELEKKLK